MLRSLPEFIREPLWKGKEGVVRWMVEHEFADSVRTRMHQQLEQIEADLVIDVGANKGDYSLLMRRLGFRGRIVAFEPIPSNAASISRLADGDPLWTVVPCALGSVEDRLPLNVMAQDNFSSLLSPNAYGGQQFPEGTAVSTVTEVPVRRLDSVLDELGIDLRNQRTHLKIDTQGYDLQVLRGAGAHLQFVQSMQCEISFLPIYEGQPGWLEALGEITGYGFNLTCLSAVSRDAELRMIEADALFRR